MQILMWLIPYDIISFPDAYKQETHTLLFSNQQYAISTINWNLRLHDEKMRIEWAPIKILWCWKYLKNHIMLIPWLFNKFSIVVYGVISSFCGENPVMSMKLLLMRINGNEYWIPDSQIYVHNIETGDTALTSLWLFIHLESLHQNNWIKWRARVVIV